MKRYFEKQEDFKINITKMLPIKIILLLLTFSLLSAVYSQKPTSGDLFGTWDGFVSSKSQPLISIKFTNNSGFIFESMGLSLFKSCTYRVDTSHATSVILLEGISQMNMKFKDAWLIKKSGADTLKIQSQMLFNPGLSADQPLKKPEWDNNETSQNTGIFVRRKD